MEKKGDAWFRNVCYGIHLNEKQIVYKYMQIKHSNEKVAIIFEKFIMNLSEKEESIILESS